MTVVTQPYFQIVEEINYMFRPFSGWAIIRLRLEYRRKLIHYIVDIKNRGTRSSFTKVGEVRSYTHIRDVESALAWRSQIATHHVTKHSTPTLPQYSIDCSSIVHLSEGPRHAP
jgi:hypothetical protein